MGNPIDLFKNFTEEEIKALVLLGKGKASSMGMLGKTASEETRKLMSEARLGKTHTEETKKKMSEASRGIPKSEEHRRNLSLANLGGNT